MTLVCRDLPLRLILLTLLLGIAVSPTLAQRQPYPLTLNYDQKAVRAFLKRYDTFKKKYRFTYLTEILDSVACTVGQLAYAVQPIQLPLAKHLSGNDSTAALLKALREFIDENEGLFHTNSKEIVLLSLRETSDAIAILFERAQYGKWRTGGETRGRLEFVISRKGELAVLASTTTRILSGLPQKPVVSTDKLYKMLIGKRLKFSIEDKQIQYEVDRIDVIKPGPLCVYEKKEVKTTTNQQGKLEMRLQRATVHLAYEVEIDIKYKKPIARIYIDAITGEELATEYPFQTN